ncbi:unnamed protein product [Tilletia controversa]|uniref:UBE2O-like SH3-B domain-containing protein n=3 Tax=Tilletia TaxID=13289 RepID=A0A8X7MIB9_9BASI|nr:hypothetical protein CF336_g9447 [Tilletia laevis]KAE8180246.1 hypothetical protein CF328_g9230 [Tilletia controversa]KAE8236579.1 hypothetical protein A4X03_0g9391 [Tilletia caries]KAE8236341.1 hypothetical protein A4X06_0g9582 [Tilletia controversa]CAD6935521.1 unnamed protein product [Tilletia caries]
MELITLVVVATRSKVRVLWQDNKQTTEPATGLIPYYNLDEYDVWPGDFVVWERDSADSEHKVGVIQTMDPKERTALVRCYDTQDVAEEDNAAIERTATELVPVFELDVHGPDPVAFGAHRGDIVFISTRPNAPAWAPGRCRLRRLRWLPA